MTDPRFAVPKLVRVAWRVRVATSVAARGGRATIPRPVEGSPACRASFWKRFWGKLQGLRGQREGPDEVKNLREAGKAHVVFPR
jgi:hypothetical protein